MQLPPILLPVLLLAMFPLLSTILLLLVFWFFHLLLVFLSCLFSADLSHFVLVAVVIATAQLKHEGRAKEQICKNRQRKYVKTCIFDALGWR